jgi:hypothetical protein
LQPECPAGRRSSAGPRALSIHARGGINMYSQAALLDLQSVTVQATNGWAISVGL